jgi:hypothetical protein
LDRRIGSGDEVRRLVILDQIGMGRAEAAQAFGQNVINIVDELLHGPCPPIDPVFWRFGVLLGGPVT